MVKILQARNIYKDSQFKGTGLRNIQHLIFSSNNYWSTIEGNFVCFHKFLQSYIFAKTLDLPGVGESAEP